MTDSETVTLDADALMIGHGKERIICKTHGDIGSVNGLDGNQAVHFNIGDGEERHYCLRCIEGLLLTAGAKCEVKTK